jgi:hypothetical protein
MSGNLRTEQNEKIEIVPNYVEYQSQIKVPLGVVIDWTPHVKIKNPLFPEKVVFDGKATNLKGMSVTPSTVSGRPSIIKGTTYEEGSPGTVGEKVEFINSLPDGTSPKFGFWNVEEEIFRFYIRQVQAGSSDFLGNINVQINIEKRKVGDLKVEGCKNPSYQLKKNAFGLDDMQGESCYFNYIVQPGKFTASYGFLQIIDTYRLVLKTGVGLSDININGKKLIDTDGRFGLYNDEKTPVEATKTVPVGMGDGPRNVVTPYVYILKTNPLCSSIEDASVGSFDYAKFAEYSLDFSTYFMMKADENRLKTELGLVDSKSYWIPLEKFGWTMHAYVECKAPPCGTGERSPFGGEPWVIVPPSLTTVIFQSHLDLPEWDNNAKFYLDSVGTEFKVGVNGRYTCLNNELPPQLYFMDSEENIIYYDILNNEGLSIINE